MDQRMTLWIGWGYKPTWNNFYIQCQHMKCVWQPSFAVDGDISMIYYHHTCWPSGRFGKISGMNQRVALCIGLGLQLQTIMELLSNQHQTYDVCLITFICRGWTCQPSSRVGKIYGLNQKEALCIGWGFTSKKMEWFPHQVQIHTYKMCLTIFACCGWGYGSISMILTTTTLVGQSLESQVNP